jgi:hypothetical protein
MPDQWKEDDLARSTLAGGTPMAEQQFDYACDDTWPVGGLSSVLRGQAQLPSYSDTPGD